MNYALTSSDAVGGLGAMRGNDFDGAKFVYTPGLQVDYETTRIHFGGALVLREGNNA